ncbi:hypothetical protein [Sulfitobacter sp. S190]|uniref:hypothetical protein n=1 Tax=Sulfitobacter sp. S190 TaxID=2867022 RepID=UPI0021A494B2|nr:hypothetical protein [Sulfitobacter sp. S190]UWR21257.1 hypothetical protein K3756_11070 [Sulfitobacter sp. S190]
MIRDDDEELKEAVATLRSLIDKRVSDALEKSKKEAEQLASDRSDGLRFVRAELELKSGTGRRLAQPRNSPSKSTGSHERDAAPKLDLVLEELDKRGTQSGDITAYSGTVAYKDHKGAEYYLLVLPKRNLEIVVSNQLNHATYISVGQRGLDFWNNRSKIELTNTLGITTVLFRSSVQYRTKIGEALDELSYQKESFFDEELVVRPEEYDPALVRECISAYWHAMGQMPKQNSGEIKQGPYANGKTTWKAVASSLRKKSLKAKHQPGSPPVPTFAELAREVAIELGVYDAYVFRDLPFYEDGVRRTILDYFDLYGEWPTITSEVVTVGPYASKTTWDIIDNALRLGQRGLAGNRSLVSLRDVLKREVGISSNDGTG